MPNTNYIINSSAVEDFLSSCVVQAHISDYAIGSKIEEPGKEAIADENDEKNKSFIKCWTKMSGESLTMTDLTLICAPNMAEIGYTMYIRVVMHAISQGWIPRYSATLNQYLEFVATYSSKVPLTESGRGGYIAAPLDVAKVQMGCDGRFWLKFHALTPDKFIFQSRVDDLAGLKPRRPGVGEFHDPAKNYETYFNIEVPPIPPTII